LDRAGHRLLDDQQAARAQGAREAAVEPLLVGDVHPAVLRPQDVEWLRAHVERQGIAHAVRDAVGEPETRREGRAGAHVRLGEVHDGDAASELAGQRAGRPAQPTAHIEHASAGLEGGQPRQPLRRALAAPVELIGGRQVVYRQRVDVLAGRGERVENLLLEAVASPVGIRRRRVAAAHGRRPKR